ncbi:3-hydroxybutyryl-CoA dehydrogenase [Kitasatospora sp. NPDC002227]|uniref:3-hydroxyacyl-CoA dehydrogenase family protein n=1 Tax=Kitasatospora sp. NPDC002227 TaxID=3154773 RepID=UPI003321CBF4
MTAATLPPALRTAAVLGLGTVGAALARSLAEAGVRVTGIDPTAPAVPGVTVTTDPGAVAGADLVVEAVPERFELKAELLRRADRLCGPETVFATTTSLSVTKVAAAGGRLPRTVGLHPVGHAPEGGAVEVVTTPVTDPALREYAEQLVRGLGRTPVSSCDRPGFVGLGLLMTYLGGAISLHERRYASRECIDAAMTLGCGLPRGPLAQLDLMGLDTALDTLTGLHELTGEARFLPPPLLLHMVTAGLLGVKSGRGFHHYPAGAVQAPAAAEATVRPVQRVGIIGSGTMAAGIAEVFARSGFDTVLVARTEVRAKTALDRVAGSLERGVKRGKIGAETARAALERLTGAEEFEAVADCDLVIEAVAEELPVKREVFRRLDQVCRPGALLSTTTSSLPVVECAAATSRPESVLGLHFFNPAPVMRLVEVVGTVLTADDALATARQLCTRLGKHPVTISDRAGFIVNSLLFPYLNAAVRLLEEHRATPEQIDTVMTAGCGYPMGPLTLLDAIGLDVSLQIQHSLHDAFRDPSLAPARPLEQLVAVGRLGRKTGRGFHSY